MLIPFLIILVHFVADFIIQTEWQARNKSKSSYALLLHVSTYTITLQVLCIIYIVIQGRHLDNNYVDALMVWCVANGVLHWITDYITSRINSKLAVKAKEKDNFHWFFVGVGADQVIHYACLFYTFDYFMLP